MTHPCTLTLKNIEVRFLHLLCAATLLFGFASATEAATFQQDGSEVIVHYTESESVDVVPIQEVDVEDTSVVLLPSPSMSVRLICRVRERYVIAPLSITRDRLVERLSAELQISKITAKDLLTSSNNCSSLKADQYPYLFYAGQEPEPSDDSATEEVALPPPAPVVRQELPYYPSSNETTVETTTETIGETSSVVPVQFSSAPQQEPPLSASTMQRILCRVQERSQNQGARGFARNIPNIAADYGSRWSMNPDVIADALRNDDLCTADDPEILFPVEAMVIDSDDTSSAQEEIVEETTKEVTEVAPKKESSSWFGGLMKQLRSLPTTVLIVAGMAALTFFALIILLIAPLLKQPDTK